MCVRWWCLTTIATSPSSFAALAPKGEALATIGVSQEQLVLLHSLALLSSGEAPDVHAKVGLSHSQATALGREFVRLVAADPANRFDPASATGPEPATPTVVELPPTGADATAAQAEATSEAGAGAGADAGAGAGAGARIDGIQGR